MLTAVGSVAWSSGPREVARGTTVCSSLVAGWVAASSVGATSVAVAGSVAAAGGLVAEDVGAQAVNKMAIRIPIRRDCFFIIFDKKGYSIKSLRKY